MRPFQTIKNPFNLEKKKNGSLTGINLNWPVSPWLAIKETSTYVIFCHLPAELALCPILPGFQGFFPVASARAPASCK